MTSKEHMGTDRQHDLVRTISLGNWIKRLVAGYAAG